MRRVHIHHNSQLVLENSGSCNFPALFSFALFALSYRLLVISSKTRNPLGIKEGSKGLEGPREF